MAGQWQFEVVHDGKLFYGMTNRSPRLDAEGHPRIVYGEDYLYFAFHDGATWHCEVADSTYGVGSEASLALDGSGWPHISYYDYSNENLKYAYRNASG